MNRITIWLPQEQWFLTEGLIGLLLLISSCYKGCVRWHKFCIYRWFHNSSQESHAIKSSKVHGGAASPVCWNFFCLWYGQKCQKMSYNTSNGAARSTSILGRLLLDRLGQQACHNMAVSGCNLQPCLPLVWNASEASITNDLARLTILAATVVKPVWELFTSAASRRISMWGKAL